MSTSAVAALIDASVASVANWVDEGRLKAGRTPGGHRRILVQDLVRFLHQQGLPVSPQLAPSAPKVLVVDDDEAVTRWVAEEIKAAHPDYEVRQAHDGFSAGDLVGSWKPDVVILDLRMPGLDGFEVCRRIKSKEDTAATAVIAMTAYFSPETKTRILECGARVCLAKQLDLEVLLREVAMAVQARG